MGIINKHFDDENIEYEEIKIERRVKHTFYMNNNSGEENNSISDDPGEPIIKLPRININNLKWFNLNNYEALIDLERSDIHAVLESRRKVVCTINLDVDAAERLFKFTCLKYDFGSYKYTKVFNLNIGSNELKINSFSFEKVLQTAEIFQNHFQSHKDDADTFFYNLCGRLICVDLSVSDELLIEQFKKWLTEERKKKQLETDHRLTDKEFLKIKQYRIIPYIDLLLWSEITGFKKSYKEKASLIFPNDIHKDAEYIRKTIQPLAERLLYSDVNLI